MFVISRIYMNHPREEVGRVETREEAQAHCKDPETSSTTCTTAEGIARTAEKGPWFEGFDEE